MKKYDQFINESKDIWQREPTKDETYGEIFYIKRPEFHTGVYDGDIVKLDKEYIEKLDSVLYNRHNEKKTTDKFTDNDYSKEYVLVNYEWYYGYALRNSLSDIDEHDFFAWVPTGYIRHLTDEEMKDYLYRKNIVDTTKKFNL